MKVGFLLFGMFFYLLAVVVEEVNRVDHALLETAYTLGAKRHHVLWLLFRASFPAIFGSFRILYDIGWTYVILAEMVNARKGVGYMVEAARKVLDFERVYAGIIAIGVAAFLFRWLLTVLEDRLFPWQRAGAASNPEPRHCIGSPWNTKNKIIAAQRLARLHRRRRARRSKPCRTSTWKSPTSSRRTAATSASSACCWDLPGCGKSTILRMIAGLDFPTIGRGHRERPAGRRAGAGPRHGVSEVHLVRLAHGGARTSSTACGSRARRRRSGARSSAT